MVSLPEPTGDGSANILKRDQYDNQPLTTIWTPPASCATAIPTLYHGDCYTTGCTESPASLVDDDLSAGLYVNFPAYTADGVETSTACMPPGYQHITGFLFSPAVGCPTGWLTATSSSALGDVYCCPRYGGKKEIKSFSILGCPPSYHH